MTITQQTMTEEQRKAIVLEYFKLLDQGNPSFLDLFAENAQLYMPKWGIANGIEEIKKQGFDLGPMFKFVTHDYAYFNYIIQGDMVVVEGTSSGVTANGTEWRAGVTHAGRFCDVFEIRDFKIQRLFIYLDPDYAGEDTARYPWLNK
ncbi:nuclear transport factor 2 family protein [Priestia megaterium]|uniref:nuclear transport factor 2 family protein n=1 Tax=Priestia megaterium TaxID=1404 RepID=UPI0026E40BB1|nr:nuclear transport factor 2 family protein [Priestia megaterium]MDO6851674.1 nuclear transport factor 2 family protein [Priestia megaterium]